MAWTLLSDDFHDDATMLSLSHAAFRLYVTSNTYAERHRADTLSGAQIAALARQQGVPVRTLSELTDAGAWVADGDRVHIRPIALKRTDDALREKRSRAGSKGADARWQANGTCHKGAIANAWQPDGAGAGTSPPPSPNTSNPPSPTETAPQGARQRVWSVWQEATGKRAKLDPKRIRAIDAAIRSHGEEDAADACRGWVHDPWPERPAHIDVTVLLRDAAHIEKFRDLWRNGPPPPTPDAATLRYRAEKADLERRLAEERAPSNVIDMAVMA